MGVGTNIKEMGGNRVYLAASAISSLDNTAAALAIPNTGTVFYLTGDNTITSITGKQWTGRKVTIACPATGSATFTGTAVAGFPGTVGNLFCVGGSAALTAGDSITFKMLDTGAWVQIAYSDNS